MSITFSSTTIIETMKLLENWSQPKIKQLLLMYNIPNPGYSRKTDRVNQIGQYLLSNQDLKGIYSDSFVLDVLKEIIQPEFKYRIGLSKKYISVLPNLTKLHITLRRDGFIIKVDKLVREIPSIVNLNEKEDLLMSLLDNYSFTIPKSHLKQALN